MTKLENKSLETLTEDLVRGVEDVNSLNLAKEVQRKAFLEALERRPALLRKVSTENGEHFLKYAIEKNYEWFVQLKKEQYFDEISQIYLYNRLTDLPNNKKYGIGAEDDTEFIVQKSIDDKILLTYVYTTPDEDELCYYDKQLGIPLSLKSCVKFTLKINNAVKTINEIDMNVAFLGEKKIKSLISEIISCAYNEFLTSFIAEKSDGYYNLCTAYTSIEAGVKKKLNEILSDYGISAMNVIVKRIAIPKEIQNKIEDQAFLIRQRKAEVEADAEFARISLQNYEAKLEVQQKYPNAEPSLTEYEKDQALKRYLIKKGRNETEEIDRSITITKSKELGDQAIHKVADIVPEIVAKPNTFKRAYFTLMAISLLVFFIMLFSEAIGGAFIVLGIATLIFGLIAAFNVERFKTPEIQLDSEFIKSDDSESTQISTEEEV